MISSKILTLGLLLTSYAAVARVKINASLELNHPIFRQKRIIFVNTQLNTNESALVYDKDGVRIETTLLTEGDTNAVICWSIDLKNSDGATEHFEPVVVASYGNTTVSHDLKLRSQKSDSFKLHLNTQKL